MLKHFEDYFKSIDTTITCYGGTPNQIKAFFKDFMNDINKFFPSFTDITFSDFSKSTPIFLLKQAALYSQDLHSEVAPFLEVCFSILSIVRTSKG